MPMMECAHCGAPGETRSMTPCAHCGAMVCAACAAEGACEML